MRLKILIANDDGIFADGIMILASHLHDIADIVVTAPDKERSASSHSLTIFQPLRYTKVDYPNNVEAYQINGTPADCVKFGLFQICKSPDLVISGINRGGNLGTDIMYSGTVNAALEGAFLGFPALAVSVASYKHPELYYERTARFIRNNLQRLYEAAKCHPHTALNINFPKVEDASERGVKFCHMGIQEYNDIYSLKDDEHNYWLSGVPIKHNRNKPECDVELSREGYITITPVTIDMTNYTALKKLSKDDGKGWK